MEKQPNNSVAQRRGKPRAGTPTFNQSKERAMTEACVFCRILSGELESSVVAEDEHAVAIMDKAQINPGTSEPAPGADAPAP
jgi:hypothetical protein